jgi:hypothetical protein
MRRRLRYLRTVRELSYRDLGGLMFDLHRFGGRRDELLVAKLTRLSELDRELRAIERALEERQPVTVLREAGVLACLRCAAIHSSDDNFCPHCGLSVSPDAERPLTTAPEAPPAPSSASGSPVPPPVRPAAPLTTAQPAVASPSAAGPLSPAPSAQPASPQPASPQPASPPVPRQAPVPGRVHPGVPRDPEATGLLVPEAPGRPDTEQAEAGPPGGQAGEDATDTTTPHASPEPAPSRPPAQSGSPAEQDAGGDGQPTIDQPTQVIRRPERPEGSTSG